MRNQLREWERREADRFPAESHRRMRILQHGRSAPRPGMIASTRLPNGVLIVVDDLARRRVSTTSQILRTIIVDALTGTNGMTTTATPAKRGRPASLFPPNGKIASTYVPARVLAVIDAIARSRMVSRVDII